MEVLDSKNIVTENQQTSFVNVANLDKSILKVVYGQVMIMNDLVNAQFDQKKTS